jgi:hypothetical protein
LLKWILRKCDGKVLIGFVWLRTRTVGRLLWIRQWILGFPKKREFLRQRATISLSGKNLLHSVSSNLHYKLTVSHRTFVIQCSAMYGIFISGRDPGFKSRPGDRLSCLKI